MNMFSKLQQGPVTLYTYIDGPKIGQPAYIEDSQKVPPLPTIFEYRGNNVFGETLALEKRIVIFGCGHVGAALYDLVRFVGYPVTMVDDRPEFANQARFLEATVICSPYEEAFGIGEFGPETCLVIATRGHSYDRYCLTEALKAPHAYVGMIGSKGKVAQTFKTLLEEGIPQQALDTVHAPIGLPLGANTPQEIAVSILAEIMMSTGKQKHMGECPLEVFKAIEEKTTPGVEILVIERSGSAPRSVGSRMFVTATDQIGSIGGGAIEAEAIKEARQIQHPCTKHYSLNTATAENLGMICGGAVTVLFIPR